MIESESARTGKSRGHLYRKITSDTDVSCRAHREHSGRFRLAVV